AAVLKEFDPACVRVEEFRKSLPPGFASRVELRPAIKEQLKRMAPGRFTDGNLDRVFDSILRNVSQVRRRPPGRLRAEVIVISMNSLLKTPADDRYPFSRLVDG